MEDQERARAKEVIGHFFNSKDEELWKLGRLMCHKLKIDYWIQLEDDHKRPPQGFNNAAGQRTYGVFKLHRKVKRYSLEEIPTSRGWSERVYQIKLEKW